MDVFNLSAILRLDSSQYESGLAQAEQKAGGLGSTLAGAAKIGAAAFAATGAAMTAFAVSSVKTGEEFDKAMSQVGATMLKTNEDMEKEIGSVSTAYGDFSGNLKEFAMFLGQNTAFSATQAAEALNYMALAGYTTQESMDMLPNVLSLAAAGNMDLARASDMVTDTQTAFGLTAERTSQMVDEMAKAASTGNTSVEQLGDAFLVVGGLAKELNGGFVTLADGTQAPVDGIQEMEIALTAMANAGIKGSEAGTHMRNMITKLSNPTKDGADWMATLGVNVFDAAGNMRSLSDIFGDLGESMQDLTQEQKIKAISEMFNARDLSSAEAMLAAIEQDWDEIGESILHAGDNEGAAAEMAKIQLDNLAGDMTLFQSALEGAQILISNALTPTLRDFVQWGTDAISTLSEAFQEGGLSGAMEALGTILTEGLANVVASFPSFVSSGISVITSLVSGIGQQMPALLSAGFDAISALAQGIINNIPTAITSIETTVTNILNYITENLPGFLDKGIELVTNLANGIVENLPAAIESAGNIINGIIDFIVENGSTFLDKGMELITNIATGISNNLPAVIEAATTTIGGVIDTIAEKLPEFLNKGIEIVTNVANGIIQNIPAITAEASNLATNAIDTIFNKLPEFLQKGVDIVTNIANGIGQNLPTIITSMGTLLGDVIAKILERLPEFLQKGVALVGEMAKGIGSNIPAIVLAMGNALLDLIAKIAQSLPDFLAKGGEIIGQIMAGIINAIPTLLAEVAAIPGKIAQKFTEFDFASIGSNIMNGIKNGIASGASAVVGAAKSAASSAFNAAKSLLGINSPSKLFRDKIGKGITEGMALGIYEGTPEVMTAMDDMNNDAIANLDDIGYDVDTTVNRVGTEDKGSSINAQLMEAIYYLIQIIEAMDESLQDKMLSAFERMRFSVGNREFARMVRNVRTG